MEPKFKEGLYPEKSAKNDIQVDGAWTVFLTSPNCTDAALLSASPDNNNDSSQDVTEELLSLDLQDPANGNTDKTPIIKFRILISPPNHVTLTTIGKFGADL